MSGDTLWVGKKEKEFLEKLSEKTGIPQRRLLEQSLNVTKRVAQIYELWKSNTGDQVIYQKFTELLDDMAIFFEGILRVVKNGTRD